LKLLLCVHGFPDELVGGTELAARFLAEGLLKRGHEVVVFAGSFEGGRPDAVVCRETIETHSGATHPLRIIRLTRPDLYSDHWHKSASARVAQSYREVLQAEAPDLVHVMHWLRLTRNLVRLAGQAGVPAVVSLNDSWVSCPLVFRVESANQSICERPISGMHCISCAGRVAPQTPWVTQEAAFMELAIRGQDIAAELSMARAVLVPSKSFGEKQLRLMGDPALKIALDVTPPSAVVRYAPRTTTPPPKPFLLGSWGHLSDLKGTDLAFEALERLGLNSGVELRLAGNEPHAGYLANLRSVYPNVIVHWDGSFTRGDLDSHAVTGVHAMLSASRAPESYGMVLEEARALGLPALLPNAGAFVERGGENSGALLFESGSAESLALAITSLRDSRGKFEALRAAVPAPTSECDVLDAHLAIYERVITSGGPSDVGESAWFAERMQNFAEDEWDRQLSQCSSQELGFD
jgi:glycosyltransferase involved in cell wall biosynthesis